LKSKKKKGKTLSSPCWTESRPNTRNPPSHAPALLRFRPIFGLPPRARQPAPRPAPLSLARCPHPSAALSLARSLPLAGWPRVSGASSSVRRPLAEVTSGRRLCPPLCHPAAQGSLAPLRPPPLDQRPRRYHLAVASPRRHCAPSPPRPPRTYKKLSPSSFFLAPAPAIPLPLPRAQFAKLRRRSPFR
jgi:hypothetical protein